MAQTLCRPAALDKTAEHWWREVTVTDDDRSKQMITVTLDSRFQKSEIPDTRGQIQCSESENLRSELWH